MLHDIIERHKRRTAEDAKRFDELDERLCMACHSEGNDRRSLYVDCFYAIEEVVPEAINLQAVAPEKKRGSGYYLRLCKWCRGEFLQMMAQWWDLAKARRDIPKGADGYPEPEAAGLYPYRDNGRTVYLTAEEIAERRD